MFFVYGAENSRACDKAEFLLYTMNLDYRIYIFGRDYTIKQLNRLIPNASTVPHVYHGTKYIGGVKELYTYLHGEEIIKNEQIESKRTKGIFTSPAEGDADQSDIHKE